jgi:DDE superfamily endonuclease
MDGMLVWIERPTAFDCEMVQCGARKFFCIWKHKYGLNMQGTCDVDGKFLDVSIQHPSSTSDFLSYTMSKLLKKLMDTPGFLAKGLVIFGDSAYVNCSYFVTPYKSVKSGSKDDFNFYHSQVRIKIECAFGMLVVRWGLLPHAALPASMGLKKTTALVLCLCRLHNYCIDCRLGVERNKAANSSVAPKEHNRISNDHDNIEEPLA